MRQFILLLTMGTLLLATACTTAQTPGQSSRNPLLSERFVRAASDAQLMRHIEYPANLSGHHPTQGHTPLTMMIDHRSGGMGTLMPESTHRLVKLMLANGADVNGRVAPNNDPYNANGIGYTPLHYAALVGNGPLVRTLIEAGADVNAQSAKGYTPLGLAVWADHGHVVPILRAAGGREITPIPK